MPGSAGGVVVDLPTYAAAEWRTDGTILEPTEWWLDVDGPAAPVAARLAAPPYSSDVVVDRAARARALSTDPVALGISGALMQGHTRNPLADPGLLGSPPAPRSWWCSGSTHLA